MGRHGLGYRYGHDTRELSWPTKKHESECNALTLGVLMRARRKIAESAGPLDHPFDRHSVAPIICMITNIKEPSPPHDGIFRHHSSKWNRTSYPCCIGGRIHPRLAVRMLSASFIAPSVARKVTCFRRLRNSVELDASCLPPALARKTSRPLTSLAPEGARKDPRLPLSKARFCAFVLPIPLGTCPEWRIWRPG